MPWETPPQHKMPDSAFTRSGGTLRDKAAFSHGVSRSVIAVGAKLNITHKLAVGRRGRSVDPLASQSYIVDQLRRGDEGVREEQ